MNACPFIDEIIQKRQLNTPPICFHCGIDYEKDENYCGPTHSTWKPVCNCLTTTAVRIVTGNNGQ